MLLCEAECSEYVAILQTAVEQTLQRCIWNLKMGLED